MATDKVLIDGKARFVALEEPLSWTTALGPRGSFCLPFLVLLSAPVAPATDVVTYHNDNFRSGQNLAETILTHSNLMPTASSTPHSMPRGFRSRVTTGTPS